MPYAKQVGITVYYRLKEPIMKILYGAKDGLYAFGYNSAKSEPMWLNLEQCEPNVRGWPWQIYGKIAQ